MWSTPVDYRSSDGKGTIGQTLKQAVNAVHSATIQTWSQKTCTHFVCIIIGTIQALSATPAVHVQDAHFDQHLVYVSLVGAVVGSAPPVIDLAS